MPATTKDPYLEELRGHVAAVFQQAQVPPVNYRKNCVNLHKIQDRSKDITEDVGRDKIRVTGEIAFQQAFLECLFRVLPTKKGDLCGDRVVRFIGAYMKFANERGACVLLRIKSERTRY
jgi:condensin complex subunit 3